MLKLKLIYDKIFEFYSITRNNLSYIYRPKICITIRYSKTLKPVCLMAKLIFILQNNVNNFFYKNNRWRYKK